jgi:hypothetical protein
MWCPFKVTSAVTACSTTSDRQKLVPAYAIPRPHRRAWLNYALLASFWAEKSKSKRVQSETVYEENENENYIATAICTSFAFHLRFNYYYYYYYYYYY